MTDYVRQFKPFSEIIGQRRAIKFLKKVMASHKIPHAYLFTGITGVGKTTAAIALTQAINCHKPMNYEGCGKCITCRQIIHGNFIDLVLVAPEGRYIKIDQIKELNRSLQFKPVSGRYRTVIIEQAETMNREAANSFLKTLEEPPPGNIIVLKVTEPLDLLPTIVSRCQKVAFRPLPSNEIKSWLIRELHQDKKRASLTARLSEGSIGKAIQISDSDFLEHRQESLLKLMKLPELEPESAIEMALEYSGKNKKATEDSMKRDPVIFELLGLWKTWYRDLMLIRIGGTEEQLINIDFTKKLKILSNVSKIEDFIDSFMILDNAQRELIRNPNLGLLMENTVLALKRRCRV